MIKINKRQIVNIDFYNNGHLAHLTHVLNGLRITGLLFKFDRKPSGGDCGAGAGTGGWFWSDEGFFVTCMNSRAQTLLHT